MNQLDQSLLSQKLQNQMQIFVRTLTGESITLDVQSTDKIDDVKRKIYDKRGAPRPDQQSLMLGGKYLSEDHTLGDYSAAPGSTIFVTARIPGGAKFGSSKPRPKAAETLVLAQAGETFYGRVVRPLGDRRFTVENTSTGMMVACRLGGSVGFKDRSQSNIKAADLVLVCMRMYESETKYNDRKGEILLRYTDGQVRQLTKAGELQERNPDAASSVVFVAAEDEHDGPALKQRNHFIMPSTAESDESDEEESEEENVRALAFARVADADNDAFALPSPTVSQKKTRRTPAKESDSHIPVDFHHCVGFVAEGSVAPSAAPPVQFRRPVPVPAPAATWIRARVLFWDAAKGLGYATPEDKRQTKAGVDVKLTVECVAGLKRPLLRDDVVEVSIDARHDRPYVLNGGLRRVGNAA